MTIRHHPDDATLLSYAAGTLPEALAVAVSAHVALCPRCRHGIRTAETVGGALLDSGSAAEIAADALDRAMARIETRAGGVATPEPLPDVADARVPAPLARRLGAGLDDIRWRWIAPGVRSHEITVSPGSGSLMLLKIAPGKSMPDHGHGGTELTMVLDGSYSDETGRYGPGDVADLDESIEHSPMVDSEVDCVCLVALEAPTRFKGRIARLLQPYLRI
ncbi:ChrR family anti-sigma-E factor [Microbaculum marinum]|uniref:ChrR family anti-sigma-E factor n=1 Tax=Microbaculum marinum TaxID=1764581 RepID=A0AAW9RQ00_9HYPH